ncbi:hypothetical protein [Paenibacillus dakarensis]|uniref:hypothetical protein n=1 Tax=Paenibacillus dakarensis TaxID=1527293 RepID=UPI000A6A7373|nr:hypothetical protein [Paenibacillus dakarensis]
MVKGDKVRHKKIGGKGIVSHLSGGWIFVRWEGSSIAIPYKAEWLEVIEEEGEHGQSNGNQSADGL